MLKKLTCGCLALCTFNSFLMGDETSKEGLKSNYQLVDYVKNRGEYGTFYGRLRSNTFYYDWEKEDATHKNYLITGVGGSVVYKSPTLKKVVDTTLGLYYSKAFFDEDAYPASTITKGKDTFSRFDYVNGGSTSMAVIGQAYLRFHILDKTQLLVGRQFVESFYAKSNDSKMIPNTFDGVVLNTTVIPHTKTKLAYLVKQKLRDHTSAHSLLMYGDENSTSATNPQWSENDDSAMHKGLTYTALKEAGVSTEAPLITGDFKNRSIKNLKLDFSFYYVPELLSQTMVEGNYKIPFNDFSVTTGVRYIKQFDDKAGEIGGAAYDGDPTGYKNKNSLYSNMIGLRVVTKYKNYKLNLAYTQVMDEADLITPWRGLPTAGYTRSMARSNWMANTKSYRAELQINQNKSGIYKNMFIQMSYLHTDADEKKGFYDEDYYYIGCVQNIPSLQDLQYRIRFGYQDTEKKNADGLDARFELNYLF